jgi:hypothetical protein
MARFSSRGHNALCEACRVLMTRGIIGSFEIRKPCLDYPCMTGDIEKVAGLTVYEPEDGVVHFARWRPLDQNAVSRSAVLAPSRESDGAGRGLRHKRAIWCRRGPNGRGCGMSLVHQQCRSTVGQRGHLAWPAPNLPPSRDQARHSTDDFPMPLFHTRMKAARQAR